MYKASANELLYGFLDELPDIEISEATDDQNVRLMKYSQLYEQLNKENQKNILEMMEDLLARQSI